MPYLPLRLLIAFLALAGLAALAVQQGRAAERAADLVVAEAVAGYLQLSVPAARPPGTGYAAEHLVSTVSRLHGAAFWHAGLQVQVGAATLAAEGAVPAVAAQAALAGPEGSDTVGTVRVWGAAPVARIPGASWLVSVGLLLVPVLAAGRRAGLLWPAAGALLAFLAARVVLQESARMAERAAELALGHVGPMAALVVLDARVPTGALERLGAGLRVREVGTDGQPAPPGWESAAEGRRATVQVARGNGVVVELALAPPAVRSRSFDLGLAGGALMAWLATWPPLVPSRRRRLPDPPDPARLPE